MQKQHVGEHVQSRAHIFLFKIIFCEREIKRLLSKCVKTKGKITCMLLLLLVYITFYCVMHFGADFSLFFSSFVWKFTPIIKLYLLWQHYLNEFRSPSNVTFIFPFCIYINLLQFWSSFILWCCNIHLLLFTIVMLRFCLFLVCLYI